ncbi:MAG: hypothetical protein ACI8QZ_000077 [Chlamydiales bacterium]|jgi:uncharacterized protein YegJ (DUF2314 family)
MSTFGETLFGRSKFIFWSLAPCLILGMLAITFPLESGNGVRLTTILACDVLALLLIACLWPYHRVPVVRRLLMGSVGLLYALYLLAGWMPELMPRPPQPGQPVNIWLASAGFLVIGVPCIKYALLGRFHLIPEPILLDPDEPLLLDAFERARASLPRLREAFRACPESTGLRFAFETDMQTTEHLWGAVVSMSETHAMVDIMTRPIEHEGPIEQQSIPLAEIQDWEAEFSDGALEGGFTTRAMCTYAAREGLPVPRYITKRVQLYRNAA